jgi:hypothetical protein
MRIHMPNVRRTEDLSRPPVQRMTWEQICDDQGLRGRWVAMDECSFDETTGRAMEGLVVDSDDDLAELCSRMRESKWKNCSIVFADASGSVPRRTRLN